MIGDAAHSMLPRKSILATSQLRTQGPRLKFSADRGQGLNNALQDSAEIIDAVKSVVFDGKPLKAAIDEYEEEMQPRGVKAAELSLQTAEMGAAWNKFTESPIFKLGHDRDKS